MPGTTPAGDGTTLWPPYGEGMSAARTVIASLIMAVALPAAGMALAPPWPTVPAPPATLAGGVGNPHDHGAAPDRTAPRITGVRLTRTGTRLVVRMRVSERALVSVYAPRRLAMESVAAGRVVMVVPAGGARTVRIRVRDGSGNRAAASVALRTLR